MNLSSVLRCDDDHERSASSFVLLFIGNNLPRSVRSIHFSILAVLISSVHLHDDKMHIRPQNHHLPSDLPFDHSSRITALLPLTSTSSVTASGLDAAHPTLPLAGIADFPSITSIISVDVPPSGHHSPHSQSSDIVQCTRLDLHAPSDDQFDPASATTNAHASVSRVSRSGTRSVQAKAARNKKSHTQLLRKRRQHTLTRTTHSSWPLLQIKRFLRTSQIPFGRLNPRRKSIVTLLFTTEEQKLFADTQLPQDIFDEDHFRRWSSTHPA